MTGLVEHMQDAFDVNAFHYLLKPIKIEKFASIFKKVIVELKETRKQNYILLHSKAMSRRVYHNDILFVESSNKKVIINCVDSTIEHCATMEEMEGLLGGGFFRCHRCYLINMEHISHYNASEIYLSCDKYIPLAQKKYAPFVNAFLLHSRKGWSEHE